MNATSADLAAILAQLSPATLRDLKSMVDGAEHDRAATGFKLVRLGLARVVFDNGAVPVECVHVCKIQITPLGSVVALAAL